MNDYETIDAILRCLYSVISGPSGQQRDWERFRSLFLPEARLILAVAKKSESPKTKVLDVEGYIRRTDPFFQTGNFWESETHREARTFGNVAHVLSYYESRREERGEAFQGGANSIQLFYDGKRWWIATVMWNTERD